MNLVLIVSLAWGAANPATLVRTSAAASATAAQDSTSEGNPSLVATTAPPWNPAAPVESRRAWEQALNFPGRVLSLPLIGLGRILDGTLAYGEAKGLVPTNLGAQPSSGRTRWSIAAPHLGGRAGVGASVELRQRVLSGAELGVRYAATLREYSGTFVRLTGQPLGLVYGNTWRPQERFYGIGAQTPSENKSNYASRAEFLRLEASTEKPPNYDWKARTAVASWIETRYQMMRAGHEPDVPSWETEFPELASGLLDQGVEHLVYGVSVLNDSRAGEPHWGRGTRLMASAERHDAPWKVVALNVGSDRGAQFNRYTLEGETGTSFGRNPRTLRLLARVVDNDITANADRMLVTDMAMLGGTTGLAGFHQGRFYGVDLLHLKTSYIFPISRRLELDLHSEWGSVHDDVWRDAKFTNFHNTFGVSLRAVYVTGPVAAVGLNWSREGPRISYSFGRVE